MFILHVKCGTVVNFSECLNASDNLNIIFVDSFWCKNAWKSQSQVLHVHIRCVHLEIVLNNKPYLLIPSTTTIWDHTQGKICYAAENGCYQRR